MNVNLFRIYIIISIIIIIYASVFSNNETFKSSRVLTLLHHQNTPYQDIKLYKTQEYKKNFNLKNKIDYYLLLNNMIQFHTREYQLSHNLQGLYPLFKYSPKKVLILGGGDGFFADLASKTKSVENITLVEIDQGMINMVKTNKTMRALTDDVFNKPNINIIINNAIDWIFKTNNKYDLIIEDIELDYTKQNSKDKIQKKGWTRKDKTYLDILKQYFYIADTISISIEIEETLTKNKIPSNLNKNPRISHLLWKNNKNRFIKITDEKILEILFFELMIERIPWKNTMDYSELYKIIDFVKDKNIYFGAYHDEDTNPKDITNSYVKKSKKLPNLGFEGYLIISKINHKYEI